MKDTESTTHLKKPGPSSPGTQKSAPTLPGRQSNLVVLLVLLGLLLAGCDRGSPAPSPAPIRDSVATSPVNGQDGAPGRIVPPSPSAPAAKPPTGHKPVNEQAAKAGTEPRVVPVTDSVATSLAPGWTRYESINQVFDLTYAQDGTLWAATGGGLVHWDPDLASYTRYDLRPVRIALAPDGTLWLVMDGELWHFDGLTARFHMAPGALDGPIRSLVVAPDGTLWVATGRDVRRFDGSDWRDYPAVAGTSMLALGPGGEVWAATHGGLQRYLPAENAWVSYTEEAGLPGRHTHWIAVSPDGQVWAYWPWEGVYALQGSLDDPVWTRLEDPCRTRLSDLVFAADGTAWASSAGSGHYPGACVAYYNGERWVDVAGDQELTGTAELAPGLSGQVAVVTSQGIGVFDRDEWRFLRDGPSSDRVTAVSATPDGAAWFGFGDHSTSTAGAGLSRFDGRAWEYHLDGSEVTALAVAPDGALWAGVGCSVQRYDGTEWQTLAACGEKLPPGNILDIDFTTDGKTWAGCPHPRHR